MQTKCIFIASNFVVHPQIFCVAVFFYLFTFAISLWHRKFVTADVTRVFVNNQHGIQQRGQDFDKNT